MFRNGDGPISVRASAHEVPQVGIPGAAVTGQLQPADQGLNTPGAKHTRGSPPRLGWPHPRGQSGKKIRAIVFLPLDGPSK